MTHQAHRVGRLDHAAANTTRSAQHSLASLVTAVPSAARVLERFGLDYCCGGNELLADACERLGLELAEVETALDALAPTPTPDWVSMSPYELVDHVEATHHAFLREEFARIEALAAKVTSVHGTRHPELAGVHTSYRELRHDLEPHLDTEERILFPMIRELAVASTISEHARRSLAEPIGELAIEHERVGELLARLRMLTVGYATPDDGCASYRALYDALAALEADTHLHVHKENNVLFPAVLAIEHRIAVAASPPPGIC